MADLECDFLIIGSGIAALRAALDLDGAGETLVLTKGGAKQGSTAFAQGGIAAAIGAGDSPELHAADTMAAGAGLCRAAAVEALTEQGPRYVRELIDWGARFDRGPTARPRSRARAPTPCGGCCTRRTPRAARSAGCSGDGLPAAPGSG